VSEITLEKVDKVRERTNTTYAEAKYALEQCDGDVLEAIIYLENIKTSEKESQKEGKYESFEEFKAYIKEVVRKGNVTRIKIKKDDRTVVDIPVNAGVAAGVIAIMLPQLLAIGVVTAIVTKLTIEITRENGEVEVVNKYIKGAYDDIKDKASDVAESIKSKVSEVKNGAYNKSNTKRSSNEEETFYTYTVNFEEEEKERD